MVMTREELKNFIICVMREHYTVTLHDATNNTQAHTDHLDRTYLACWAETREIKDE